MCVCVFFNIFYTHRSLRACSEQKNLGRCSSACGMHPAHTTLFPPSLSLSLFVLSFFLIISLLPIAMSVRSSAHSRCILSLYGNEHDGPNFRVHLNTSRQSCFVLNSHCIIVFHHEFSCPENCHENLHDKEVVKL